MIYIYTISNFWTPTQAKNAFTNVFLKGRNNYTEFIKFVDDNTYTHVILLNAITPSLSISKRNVLGIANEPNDFLRLDNNFVNYINNYCSKYILGKITSNLSENFIKYYPFMCHPWERENYFNNITPKKNFFMSIPYSGKSILPGHKYRKQLIEEILKTNLDIHIWGRGCNQFLPDPRLKGEFKEMHGNVIYDYEFIIQTENSESDEYISDKFPACIALNTVPIYWGAKNIEKYFGKNACIRLKGDVKSDIKLLIDIFKNKDKYKLDLSEARKELFEGKAYFMKFLYNYWVLDNTAVLNDPKLLKSPYE